MSVRYDYKQFNRYNINSKTILVGSVTILGAITILGTITIVSICTINKLLYRIDIISVSVFHIDLRAS